MTNQVRHGLAALVALICAVVLSACVPPTTTTIEEATQQRLDSAQPAVTAPTIGTDGVLKIGILEDAGLPAVYNNEDGYVGIDVTCGAALAAKMGLKAEFVPLESAKQAKSAGVDVVMGVTNASSPDLVVVSSYMERAIGVFTRDTPSSVPIDALSLGGKTVAVQKGSEAEKLFAGSNLMLTIKTFDTLNDVFDALKSGVADYAAGPAYPGGYLAHRLGDISLAGLLDVPVPVGIGVLASNMALVDAVQKAADSLVTGGALEIGRAQWVGSMPTLTADLKIGGFDVVSPSTSDSSEDETADTGDTVSSLDGPADGSEAGANAVTDL